MVLWDLAVRTVVSIAIMTNKPNLEFVNFTNFLLTGYLLENMDMRKVNFF